MWMTIAVNGSLQDHAPPPTTRKAKQVEQETEFKTTMNGCHANGPELRQVYRLTRHHSPDSSPRLTFQTLAPVRISNQMGLEWRVFWPNASVCAAGID